MKLRKIIFSLAIVIMLISCISFVNAVEVSARLISSSTTVKKGEQFTVTIYANCSDGINTFATSIQYDKNVLELVNGAVSDSSKWINLGENANVSIFSNSRENITSADLYVMTFKVKDTANIGNTVISAGTITIDSNAESNSISTIDAEAVTINVSETGSIIVGGQTTLSSIKISTPPTKTTFNAGEKFNASGMVVKAVYSDGTEKEITDYKYSPSDELGASSTRITITYTENGVTKTATQIITVNSTDKDGKVNNTTNNVVNRDNTVTNNTIADTGLEDNMGIIFVAIAIIAIASYIQYKKYKNV